MVLGNCRSARALKPKCFPNMLIKLHFLCVFWPNALKWKHSNYNKEEGTENYFNMWSISTRPRAEMDVIYWFCSLCDMDPAPLWQHLAVYMACKLSQCMFSTQSGRSIQMVFPHPTPSSCSSASCPTQLLNLLTSGRLLTKTTTPRSGSPSTVRLMS